MNSNSENFEALRKLMALKRHEQPPPGYFDRLPDKIAARLVQEGGAPSFWDKIVAGFSFRPSFAYSFALAAFGALTFSLFSTTRSQPQAAGESSLDFGWRSGATDETAMEQDNAVQSVHLANWMGNTNPSVSSLPSLFSSRAQHQDRVMSVSYASP
jgi:hypothetical protein